MMYEMTLEMYVGAREEREAVVKVAQKALRAKGCEQFADDLKADKKDCYMITNDVSFDVTQERFDEAISTIYKAIIKELPDVLFQGTAWNGAGTCDMTHSFDKRYNTLMIETTYADGEGICNECDTEVVDIEAHLTERSCCRSTSKTCTYNDNIKLELVLWVNQALMSLIVGPFLRYWSLRYF